MALAHQLTTLVFSIIKEQQQEVFGVFNVKKSFCWEFKEGE